MSGQWHFVYLLQADELGGSMLPLRDYQQKTIDFVNKTRRCAITSAAGTGKSRCVIEAFKFENLFLVICPAYLRTNWERELVKWGCQAEVTIVSYEYCLKKENLKKLMDMKFPIAIVDESTACKNWEAKRTRHICGTLLVDIPSVVFMSATPVKQSALDLHPLLHIINPGVWGEPDAFAHKYCGVIPNPWTYKGVKYVGFKNETVDELRDAWKKVSIKFRKEDVLTELPPIMEQDVYFDDEMWSPSHRVELFVEQLEEEFVSDEAKAEHKFVGILKVRHVLSLIDVWEHEPTIIFTWHRSVGERLESGLKKMKKKVGLIDGGVPQKQRTVLQDKFQNGELDYLVMSIPSSSMGLNLPRASRVIYAEMPWTYTDYYQSYSRAHRMTTEHVVTITRCVMEASIDNSILKMLGEKKELNDKIAGEV